MLGGAVWLAAACTPTPRFEPSTWRVLVADGNGVTFRAPADYQPRNEYGCWTRADDRWGSKDWRDLCVDTLDSGRSYSLADPPPCRFDCVTYEELRVDTLVLGGRRAVVERAFANGGMSAMHRERQLLVRITTEEGTVLTLHGSVGDAAGYDELLAIAATMRPIRDAPHLQASAPAPSD